VSDSNKPPKPPPPDDFSKTTPNINLSDDDDDTSGWDKTNYRYPAQPPADDWGNTVNFNTEEESFGAAPGAPKVPDWGITRADINIDPDDYGSDAGSRSADEDFGKTTPYFQLPQAEREKYQKLPPTPAEEAAEKKSEEKAKGGIPTWVWASGALFAMFSFAILALIVVYLLIPKAGYDLVITDVPAGSQIFINDSPWGETTSVFGTKKLPNLKAGETKRVAIVNPNFKCVEITITGRDGADEERKADCTKAAGEEISKDCLNFKAGEYQKSRDCAYEQLSKLGDPPNVDDLIKAMNLYINHFDSGSAEIREVDRKFLETAAGYMKKIPEDVVIEVGGHTDSDGGDADNQALSERRAKAVRDELIKAGVKESMLTMKGYGEKVPKTTNDTDDGKFQNRRIEYKRANQ
jgi:outer membrane protein OmpA-like peptidoglycan-associated protein